MYNEYTSYNEECPLGGYESQIYDNKWNSNTRNSSDDEDNLVNIDRGLPMEVNIPLEHRGELVSFREVRMWKSPTINDLLKLKNRINDELIKPLNLKQQDIVRASGLGAPYVCYLLKDPNSPNMNRRRKIEVFSVLTELFRKYDAGQITKDDFIRLRNQRVANRFQGSRYDRIDRSNMLMMQKQYRGRRKRNYDGADEEFEDDAASGYAEEHADDDVKNQTRQRANPYQNNKMSNSYGMFMAMRGRVYPHAQFAMNPNYMQQKPFIPLPNMCYPYPQNLNELQQFHENQHMQQKLQDPTAGTTLMQQDPTNGMPQQPTMPMTHANMMMMLNNDPLKARPMFEQMHHIPTNAMSPGSNKNVKAHSFAMPEHVNGPYNNAAGNNNMMGVNPMLVNRNNGMIDNDGNNTNTGNMLNSDNTNNNTSASLASPNDPSNKLHEMTNGTLLNGSNSVASNGHSSTTAAAASVNSLQVDENIPSTISLRSLPKITRSVLSLTKAVDSYPPITFVLGNKSADSDASNSDFDQWIKTSISSLNKKCKITGRENDLLTLRDPHKQSLLLLIKKNSGLLPISVYIPTQAELQNIDLKQESIWDLQALRVFAEEKDWLGDNRFNENAIWILWDFREAPSAIGALIERWRVEYKLSDEQLAFVTKIFLSQYVYLRDIEIAFEVLLQYALENESFLRAVEINCDLTEERLRVKDSFVWDIRQPDWALGALISHFVHDFHLKQSAISSLFIDLKLTIICYRKEWVQTALKRLTVMSKIQPVNCIPSSIDLHF